MSDTQKPLRLSEMFYTSAAQRIAELEKQLAERDAALARCVEALEIAQDFLTSEKKTILPWGMDSVPLNKIPEAIRALKANPSA